MGKRVGTPSLDIYILQTPDPLGTSERLYVSNEEYHCNPQVCTVWQASELKSFVNVTFGEGWVLAPIGAPSFLSRVYGADWNVTVRAHNWALVQGKGFEARSFD